MGVDGDGSAGTSTPPPKKCAHGHAWYGLCVQVLPSWSYFDALQRRRVRRSRARRRYFEGSRVCRHVIVSKELQTLP